MTVGITVGDMTPCRLVGISQSFGETLLRNLHADHNRMAADIRGSNVIIGSSVRDLISYFVDLDVLNFSKIFLFCKYLRVIYDPNARACSTFMLKS